MLNETNDLILTSPRATQTPFEYVSKYQSFTYHKRESYWKYLPLRKLVSSTLLTVFKMPDVSHEVSALLFVCLFAFVCTFCDYAMTYKDCLGTRPTIIGRTWYSLHIYCEWISFLFIISLMCRNLQVWFAFRFSEIWFM